MEEFVGMEKVNVEARQNQHLLNKALWQKLTSEGFDESHAGRVTGFFISLKIEQAGQIIKEYDSVPGCETDVLTSDSDPAYYAQVTCPLSHFSQKLFDDLSDMFMISAVEADSEFEGLEVDVNAIVSMKKPWWKIW